MNGHVAIGTQGALFGPGKALAVSKRKPDPRSVLPDEFPSELRPHARAVLHVLRSTAEIVGANAPQPLALAHVIMARPRRPLVRAAHDWAAWVHSQSRRRWPKDVVASYRNWLDRGEVDLASVEVLPGADAPGLPANVTPIGAPRSAEERRMVRQTTRMAIARGELPASAMLPPELRLRPEP